MPNRIKNKKGFTIIEVVLVLAIAGLIFLMVFIALPALQSGQRDTQRRNDMSRVVAALTSYQTNNNGNLPNSDNAAGSGSESYFISSYLGGDDFKDPDGTLYKIHVNTGGTTTAGTVFNHTIYLRLAAKCGEEKAVSVSGQSSKFAIVYALETGGMICLDNS
ncbi:MAG: type II secretion system protein [Candidatus Saccharibacteria bacterium]|nr:type II secretion system protein [Candidatus Saccharibacteria bacterium]